jgi:hypothetical protein
MAQARFALAKSLRWIQSSRTSNNRRIWTFRVVGGGFESSDEKRKSWSDDMMDPNDLLGLQTTPKAFIDQLTPCLIL